MLPDDVINYRRLTEYLQRFKTDFIKDLFADYIKDFRTNFIINGNFNVWQRNTTAAANDDVYSGADRWNFLTETNGSWTVARDTDAPKGSRYSMKCTNVTTDKQMAVVTILENIDSECLNEKKVSFAFQAKTSGTEIFNLRAAILTWGSTADVVTSDVIGTWAQDGTNPTWATNWTMENVPYNLPLKSDWQRFKIENISIDSATVNNVALVIWVDDGTLTTGDDFWLAQVQLNVGETVGHHEPTLYADDYLLCQRYYQKLTTPHMVGVTVGVNSAITRLGMPLPVRMRIAPACSFGAINLYDGNSAYTLSSVSASYHTNETIEIDGTASGNWTGANRPIIGYSGSSSAVVEANAEL